MGGINLYYDNETGRVTSTIKDGLIGEFDGNDKLIVFYKNGNYEISNYEGNNRYNPDEVLKVSTTSILPEPLLSRSIRVGISSPFTNA